MKIVTLNLIATNKYSIFLDGIMESARNLFVNDCKLKFIIYTNDESTENYEDVKKIQVDNEPWPMPTLKRFHYFIRAKKEILESDFSFYIDVDSLFKKELKISDISTNDKFLAGTLHPGFINANQQGTPERNPKSRAFIELGGNDSYYCGGFFGGDSESFISMAETISGNIDLDLGDGIIAIWHDESHLNRYFLENKPDVIFGHNGFSCPSQHLKDNDPIITFLDKGDEENKNKLRND
jgi:hypothetical protein